MHLLHPVISLLGAPPSNQKRWQTRYAMPCHAYQLPSHMYQDYGESHPIVGSFAEAMYNNGAYTFQPDETGPIIDSYGA
jgi:hypothetical protein